jgi:hypothetical protein
LCVASASAAQETPNDVFAFRTSIKASALVFRTPDAPELFPERTGSDSLLRTRLELFLLPGGDIGLTFAYEQRLRHRNGAGGLAGLGILPAHAADPFRVRRLQWDLVGAQTAWVHEIDRASVQLHAGRAELTIGRQAVGWGRGVLFGAVDLFAPFAPLEADREWRPGIDAVRADLKLTDRSSLDLVGAFGRTGDQSALAARLRGYFGLLDVEIVAGRRARDALVGASASAAIADAEVHGELAAFRPPGDDPLFGSQVVWKAVAGGSYRLPVGEGILVYAEYHYSGFGAADPGELLSRLSSPAFIERYVRGDTQILSTHATALLASYQASPELGYSGQWIHNPADGSGVLVPSVSFTWNDALSVTGSVYLPYGHKPKYGMLRSEYGTSSMSGLLQLRLYL